MDPPTPDINYKFISNTAHNNRKKRRLISIQEKKFMIELYEQGYSHQDIANRYSIGRSTVTKILLSNNNSYLDGYTDIKQKRKLIVEDKLDNLENKLLQRCFEKLYEHGNVDYILKGGIKYEDVIKTALEIAEDLNIKCFKGNTSWFNKFRKKYKVNLKEKATIGTGEETIYFNCLTNDFNGYLNSEYINHPLSQLNNVNIVDFYHPTTTIINPTLMLPNNLEFSPVTSPNDMYTYENVQNDAYFNLTTQEFNLSFSYQDTYPF